MNFSVSALVAGLIFGVIGVYWVKRAKREAHPLSAIFGITLIAYPYFIENIYLLWGVGVVLCGAAYLLADY